MNPSPASRINRFFIGVLHVACPLLFFTNLTRNPYFTQIALLNMLICIFICLWGIQKLSKENIEIPRFSFELPLVVFLAVAFLSSGYSYLSHPILRSGIASEALRVWVFTWVNCLLVIYIPILYVDRTVPSSPKKEKSLWTDLTLAFFWGLLWFGFHEMKDRSGGALWDTYGAFLWAGGLLYAFYRTRNGNLDDIFSVIFTVSFLAAAYGIIQYAGRDMIWGSPIQPYGGRPVSTFGNPNFLSSHLMMTSPLAFSFGIHKPKNERWAYFLVALITGVAVLCTLTRSTYVGIFTAYLILGLLTMRHQFMAHRNMLLGVLVGFLLLLVVFPHTPLSRVQSPLNRFIEIYHAYKTGDPYGPWDQRILIWSCAWDMVKSHFLLAKGWGCFELFYPFYQGHYVLIERFVNFRTHANNAHNVLLEMWSQTGFLGTGASIWLITTILYAGWNQFKKTTEVLTQFKIAGILAALSGMLVDNFFGNVSIFFAVPAFLFWWLVGCLLILKPVPDSQYRSLHGYKKNLLLAMVFFPTLFSGVYYFQRWEQEVNYFKGFKEAKAGAILPSIKSLEMAMSWFSKEVNTSYEMGNSYSRYAHELSNQGRSEEAKAYNEKAIEAFKKALESNPGYDEIYFNLGICQKLIGQSDEAVKSLSLCLFINPLFRDGYNSLGNMYITDGKYDQAIRLFEQGVSVFPRDRDLWNNLGYVHTQMKNDEKSFEAYKKAVELDPSFQQGWSNLAIAARSLKKRDPIMEIPGLIAQMEDFLKQKNYQNALKPSERIVEILPRNADAHLSLGNIYFYLQKIEKSEEEYKTALAINPQFVVAYTNLGQLYLSQQKTGMAQRVFQKALEIQPDNAEAKLGLSRIK